MADAHPMPGPLHRASVAAAATAEPPCGMGFINTVCEFRDALETFCQKADKAEDPDWSKKRTSANVFGRVGADPGADKRCDLASLENFRWDGHWDHASETYEHG